MRKTFAWILVLLFAISWVAWSQFQQLWSRRDEIVADRIRNRLAQLAPEWRIEFESAELLEQAQVRLKNLHVGSRDRNDVLLSVPELLVSLDPKLLADGWQVLIKKVEVDRPVLRLRRGSAGRWNWQDLPPLPGAGLPTPEILCHDGAVEISVEATEFVPQTRFDLARIDMRLENTAFHAFAIHGSSSVDTAGALEFDGTLNLDTLAWTLSGRCPELRSPDSLLQLVASLSREADLQLRELAAQRAAAQHSRGDVPVRTAAHVAPATADPSRCVIPALGVAARLELAFNLSSSAPDQPLQYQLGARIRDGVLDNPALPVPLRNLEGELFLDNSQVILRSFHASNRDSRLHFDGCIRRDGGVPSKRFVIQAHNLEFGPEIQTHLWGGLRRLYDAMRPAGRFNIDIAAECGQSGDWNVTLNQFEVFDSSILVAQFPYPLDRVAGRIWQEGDRFVVDFTGMAGERPITARGEFRRPGPNLTLAIDVQARNLQIDEALRSACATPQLQPARTALEKLRLTGRVDVNARVVKRGIPTEPVRVAIDASLHHGAANYEGFPYAISDLSARLVHDPLAADPAKQHIWQFLDVRGRHGPAVITASGGFAVRGPHSLLDLVVTSLNTPIDRELEQACLVASPPLRELFDSLGRAGAVDLENIRLLWTPGGKPVVAVPDILLKDAIVRLKYWPYQWERVTGKLAWENHRLTIASLAGWYGGETYLQIDNHGEPTAAALDFPTEGEVAWQLHLEDVRIRKLVPDSVFRRSLIPSGVAAVVEKLDPRGPMDLDIGLDVKAYRQQPRLITAAWHLDAALHNNAVTPGLELSGVTGTVKVARGLWDGARSFVDGYFELESATALGIPLRNITGPFCVDGDNVSVGNPPWADPSAAPPYDPEVNRFAARDVQAEVYGGKLGCSLQAKLSAVDPEQTTYRAAVTLRDALLQEWAGDNGFTSERLRGPINGQIDFVGQGTSDRAMRGQGWVQISPAQLYELPVLNRVLASFELRQPDRTAFTYAYGEFQIRDGLFDFSLIDLVGESLRLVGRGTVAYAEGLEERLAINFYRSKFRNRIPIVGQVISAVTTNSIGVRVGGTISTPIVNVQPKLGIIDDTLRNLIDTFDAGQMPVAPRPIQRLGPPVRNAGGPP